MARIHSYIRCKKKYHKNYVKISCGAAGNRTPVQIKYNNAFYMLIIFISFRVMIVGICNLTNTLFPKFRPEVGTVFYPSLKVLWYATLMYIRHQSVWHKGFLIPRIRQPWQIFDCQLLL